MNLLKKLFCKHNWRFVRNIFGDEINHLNARSEWKCTKCGKIKKSQNLWYESISYDLNDCSILAEIKFK